jgi:hypothetical protein
MLLPKKQKDRPKAVSLIDELPCLGQGSRLDAATRRKGCAVISIVESGHLAADCNFSLGGIENEYGQNRPQVPHNRHFECCRPLLPKIIRAVATSVA